MDEAERKAITEAMVADLEGALVEVAGNLVLETMTRPLTRAGVQMLVDRLKSRDWKIVRA